MHKPVCHGAVGAALLVAILAGMVLATGCSEVKHERFSAAPEWAPFVDKAKQAMCSETLNRLFVVDNVLVFWERAGGCPDAAYSEVLYGGSTDKVLCVISDSIGGPVKNCPDPSYEAMFDIMIAHFNDPNLGLGPGHTVQELPLWPRQSRG